MSNYVIVTMYVCFNTLTAQQPFSFLDPPLNFVETFFTTTTSQAVIRCPIQPGALTQLYYGTWTRNGATLVEIPEPVDENNPRATVRSDTRFDIDRNTFSLIISSVEANDAGNNYQCFLRVFNPLSSNTIDFRTDVVQLTLMVNGNGTAIVLI